MPASRRAGSDVDGAPMLEPSGKRPRARRIPAQTRAAGALAAGLLLIMLVSTAANCLRWIGTPFPGFLVMPNRVVASAGLAHWSGTRNGTLFQHVVEAVEGQPVTTSAEVYALVRRLPAGTPVHYTLRGGDGVVETTIPSMRFSGSDWALLFGAYLLNGATFGLVALILWQRHPRSSTHVGALALCATAAVFAVTGADLYGSHLFYRLYVASEALLPATVIHLALVFPREKLGAARRAVIGLVYLGFGLLAVIYEACQFVPAAFTLVRNLCAASAGIAVCGLIATLIADYVRVSAPSVRVPLRAAITGTAASLALPALLLAASGVSGGVVGVSAAAFTAFLFPLYLGFALGRSFTGGPLPAQA